MKLTISFLFVASAIGLAVCQPFNQVIYQSYQQGPNTVVTTWNSDSGVMSQNIISNSNTKDFPRQWTAEFINLVDEPDSNVIGNLLAKMDDRQLWRLKPYLPDPNGIPLNAWNVQIRVPKEWRTRIYLQTTNIDGNIYTSFLIHPTNAGTEVIQSQYGNYQPNSAPHALEVDQTIPVSLTYKNNKLSVAFSVRREQN